MPTLFNMWGMEVGEGKIMESGVAKVDVVVVGKVALEEMDGKGGVHAVGLPLLHST